MVMLTTHNLPTAIASSFRQCFREIHPADKREGIVGVSSSDFEDVGYLLFDLLKIDVIKRIDKCI